MHHFPKPSLSFSYSPTRSAQWTLYRPCTALYKAPSKRRSGCVPLPSLCFVVCSPVSPLVLPPLCTLPLCAHPVDVALRAGLLSTAPFLCLSLIPREALHASLVSLLFSLLALLSFGPSAHISLSLSLLIAARASMPAAMSDSGQHACEYVSARQQPQRSPETFPPSASSPSSPPLLAVFLRLQVLRQAV